MTTATHAERPRRLAFGEEALEIAVRALTEGSPVAIPTETVYGLAARADEERAVAAIYAAKGRPDFNPLIVHVPDAEAARKLAHFNTDARKLAAAFWPGPLTMVLPRRIDAPLATAVTAGLSTVALRCPAHPAAQAILARCGFPLAAPSANRSGAVSPTTAEHVVDSLAGRIDFVIDDGPTPGGLESTIVAPGDDGWRILRPGSITSSQIGAILGSDPVETIGNEIEAPGQLASHYAPGKPVRLNALTPQAGEFHIGFDKVAGDTNLSDSGNLFEAAARLYACLHEGARSEKPCIAIAPIPFHGVGEAINDRLGRAAA